MSDQMRPMLAIQKNSLSVGEKSSTSRRMREKKRLFSELSELKWFVFTIVKDLGKDNDAEKN